MTASDLAGVVLAGGASSRFEGADKALAPLDGRPLLAHVVASLETATGRAAVVAMRDRGRAGRYADVLPERTRFADDDASFEGPLAGLFGGLDALETGWAFVCGCDMPGLSPAAIEWLADRRDADVDAVVVRPPGGVRESLHALYRVDAALAVRGRLPAAAGPQALLDALPVREVPPTAAPPDVDLSASLANVNTRADLRDLE